MSVVRQNSPLHSVNSARQAPRDDSISDQLDTPMRNHVKESLTAAEQDKNLIELIDEEYDAGTGIGLKRKLKSKVWEEFKRFKLGVEWKAVCIHCNEKLVGDTKKGTTHLHNHLKRCNFRKRVSSSRQEILNFTKESSGKVNMGTYNLDQEKCRSSLAKAVILHEYPLSIVEHVGFRSFLNDLQPIFKVPSCNTLKNDIIKIYDYEKKRVMAELEVNESQISITTDMWTASNQKRGFMAITAHYIDDSWNLQSRVIRFTYVPCPHTAEVLAETLGRCLLDWNIDRKLMSVTIDNCSTNDKMITSLIEKLDCSTLLLAGEFLHTRCCAHILSIIVQEGLDAIKPSVKTIRESVAYWTATPKRSEKFEQVARLLK